MTLDKSRDASSVLGMDDVARADMRIEIVKRELNQGALAGLSSAVNDYAARLVVAALDSFDVATLDQAHAEGFREGFRKGHQNGVAYQKSRG